MDKVLRDFEAWDRHGTGVVPREALAVVLRRLNPKLQEEQVDALLGEAVSAGIGGAQVDYRAFCAWLWKPAAPLAPVLHDPSPAKPPEDRITLEAKLILARLDTKKIGRVNLEEFKTGIGKVVVAHSGSQAQPAEEEDSAAGKGKGKGRGSPPPRPPPPPAAKPSAKPTAQPSASPKARAGRISEEELAKRREAERQQDQARQQLELERQAHWRSMASRSISAVPWDAIETSMWCEGRSGGAVLVQVGNGEAVVVKPQGPDAAGEALALEVAALVGVRVAANRLIAASEAEFSELAAALQKAPSMREEHKEKFKHIVDPGKHFVAIVEFVQGTMLRGLEGQQAIVGESAHRVLPALGSLMALDCLLNNLDRLPAIWDNEGNLSNVMVTSSGEVVGIDQQVNLILPVAQQAYLDRVRRFCGEAKLGLVGADSMVKVKRALHSDCGVQLEDSQCKLILEGASAALGRVAQRRGTLLAALQRIGDTLKDGLGNAGGVAQLDSMVQFVSACIIEVGDAMAER